MGSELKVESQEGKGSRFYFEVEFEHCNTTLTLANRVKSDIKIYLIDSNTDVYKDILTQLQYFGLNPIETTFEDLICSRVPKEAIIITFNHKQYKPLLNISSRVILVDNSHEAFNLARDEDIIYHIGLFEEAPSVLYNAILNYTSTIKNIEHKGLKDGKKEYQIQ